MLRVSTTSFKFNTGYEHAWCFKSQSYFVACPIIIVIYILIVNIIIIIFIIIRGRQCKPGRERFTPISPKTTATRHHATL